MGDTRDDDGQDIQGMSLDRLRALRPDLQITDPARVLEAREVIEEAVDKSEIGGTARAALKQVIREAEDPVTGLINGMALAVHRLDLSDEDRDKVLGVVKDAGAKLGVDVPVPSTDGASEGEGEDEGESEGEQPDATAKGDEGSGAGDGGGESEGDDVAGQLEARDALDEALENEDLQATEAVKREVRKDVRKQINAGLRGTEAVEAAVQESVERYHRVIEAVKPGSVRRPAIPDSGDEGGSRATEGKEGGGSNPGGRFYPQPVKED